MSSNLTLSAAHCGRAYIKPHLSCLSSMRYVVSGSKPGVEPGSADSTSADATFNLLAPVAQFGQSYRLLIGRPWVRIPLGALGLHCKFHGLAVTRSVGRVTASQLEVWPTVTTVP